MEAKEAAKKLAAEIKARHERAQSEDENLRNRQQFLASQTPPLWEEFQRCVAGRMHELNHALQYEALKLQVIRSEELRIVAPNGSLGTATFLAQFFTITLHFAKTTESYKAAISNGQVVFKDAAEIPHGVDAIAERLIEQVSQFI